MNYVWLVARREINSKLRDKAFLVGVGLMMVILLGSLIANMVISSRQSDSHDRVATIGTVAQQKATQGGLEAVPVHDVADGEQLLRSDGPEQVKAIAEIDADGVAHLTAVNEISDRVSGVFTVDPEVTLLEPRSGPQMMLFAVSLVFAMLFFLVSIMFGMGIAQSVVEEKETRVVELLVAAIPVRYLLAGKIIGNVILALGSIALLVVLGVAGMHLMDSPASLQAVLNGSVGWFLAYFVFGFVMVACLWAVCGSLANRQEEVGAATMPMQLILMLPFFVSTYSQSPNTAIRVLSWIPFTSPIAMPKRVVLGDVSWWQPAVGLGLLAVTIVVVILVGARIYRGALLQTTGKANLRKAWAASAPVPTT